MEFIFEKCKTKGAYSAKLKTPNRLDLRLLKGKVNIVSETPVLYLVKEGKYEIIVHAYGELLFKEGTDVEEMKKIAQKLYSLLKTS